MGIIYVCPKCELQVKYSKIFCVCGTQLVRTDDALADDVFRKYRKSNGIEDTKILNEEKINIRQNITDKLYIHASEDSEKSSKKINYLISKKIIIHILCFISIFFVSVGFTFRYASYKSYLSLFFITLILYVANYKINLGNYSASIKKTAYWLFSASVFISIIVMEINPFIQRFIVFIDNSYKYGSCSVGRFFSSPPKLYLTNGERVAKEIYENPPKNISPINLNSLFSEGTDLQKTNAEKSITGQNVKWKLKVKNVSAYTKISVEILTEKGTVDNRSEQWKSFYDGIDRFFKDAMNINSSFSSFGGLYDNQNVGVNIILDLDSHDASYLNSLKGGDWIVVRGKIDSVIGDRVRLSPAVLDNSMSISLYETAKNKVNQHKVDYQKYKEGSCKFKSSGKRSEEQLQQVNSDKRNDVSLANESNKTLPQVTIKQITEYNSYCSKKSINCNWDTLTKQFPLNWEKDEAQVDMDDVYFRAGSRDFKIGTEAYKEGTHDNLYISSKYLDGQKKLRKLLESSHSFEKKICRKPSDSEDVRNYIYKTSNGFLFIVYKIESGKEIIHYFNNADPYEADSSTKCNFD
jgi:hypothetical protein